MNKPEPIYNLSFLGDNTDLNIEEGIRKSGSRRAYFDDLSGFEPGARQILANLLEKRTKKELQSDLSELLKRLLSICDTGISGQVEKALILAKRNGDDGSMSEQLYKIRQKTLYLINMIQEAVTGPFPVAPAKHETGEPESEEQSRDEKSPAALTADSFAALISHIENFNSDAALDELKAISSNSYGNEIDTALHRARKYLADFDYEKSAWEIKKIINLTRGTGSSGKKSEKKKILAIDDMPDILNTLKSLLKNDYNVYCVTNHTAALKFLTNNTPDLIFIDIEMPDMNGFTLVKIIRQIEACKRTPVVFLTGNVSVENVMTSLEAGGNDFIKKPIDYKILVAKIRNHLGKDGADG